MSSGATSNAAAVKARLEALVASVSFTSPGKDQNLGRDLLADAAAGIADRSIGDQVDPDGNPWGENLGKYAERKAEQGLPIGIGLPRKGGGSAARMLSLQQLKGEQTITPDSAVMKYGVDADSRRRGQWFSNGSAPGDGESSGAVNQVARRFYGLDADLKRKLVESCREHIRDLLRK